MPILTRNLVCCLLAATLCSCEEPERMVVFETIESDCRNQCEIVIFVCDDASQSMEDFDGCVEECLGFRDASLEQGERCAQSFENMMSCVGKLETCSEIFDWSHRAPNNRCEAASTDFDKVCEDF